jgi:hypothetical protein
MSFAALDLRRIMAQRVLNEAEYRDYLGKLTTQELERFFAFYDNPEIQTPDQFIAWLKKMGVLK